MSKKSRLPRADNSSNRSKAIVANIIENNQKISLNAEQFGNYVVSNYETFNFPLLKNFVDYRENQVMAQRLASLKAGMDEVSCAYIDHHERLLDLAKCTGAVLVKKDFLWTAEDQKLFKNYHTIKEQGTIPLVNEVNLEWGSSITNRYGMYDVPAEKLSAVNGKAVIDAGGYIGDSLSLFRALFPESKIHTFEPSKASFETLTNLFKQDINQGNIIPVQKGLGDEKGTLKLSKAQGLQSDSTASMAMDYGLGPDSYEEAEVITLDEYVQEHNLSVGLIKVDVEGFEPQVLKGALNTIKTQRPMLVLAIYHSGYEFYELKSVIEALNLNYSFQIRRGAFCNPLTELDLIAIPN